MPLNFNNIPYNSPGKVNSPGFLVIGDFMLDRYVNVASERFSAEAPIPIWTALDSEVRPGGAGNVAENLIALGNKVWCLGGSGDVPEKMRIMLNGQQIVRVDFNDTCTPPDLGKLRAWCKAEDIDAIVVADYCKGSITPEVREIVMEAAKDVPVFVDTKGSPNDWIDLTGESGVWLFPNGIEFDSFTSSYLEAGNVVLKKGSDGIARMHEGQVVEQWPAFSSPLDVVDVCGCGDTVVAAFAHALLRHPHTSKSMTPLFYANLAAAVVVRKSGTSTCTEEEIEELRRSEVISKFMEILDAHES